MQKNKQGINTLVGMWMIRRKPKECGGYSYYDQGKIVGFDGHFYICDIYSFLHGMCVYSQIFPISYFENNEILLFYDNEDLIGFYNDYCR